MTQPLLAHKVLLTTAAPALPLQQEPPLDRFVNGLALIIVLFIIAICLIGFVLVLAALLPSAGEQSKLALRQSPWRAFFIGLANYLFLGGISLLLMSTQIPPLGVIGLLIAAFLTTVTALGLVGLVMMIGEQLQNLSGREVSRLMQLVGGTIVLEFGVFLPFVGWFLLMPVLLMASFGAAVLAWRNRKQIQQEPRQPES